jgi:hypothetical protein
MRTNFNKWIVTFVVASTLDFFAPAIRAEDSFTW